jgi:MOSC domain-containing protein YiiM
MMGDEQGRMRVVSVNVGRPREIQARGRTVTTSIVKTPVPGRVRVNPLNIEGDQQSDLRVHGGVTKAVYVYPSEHYTFWRSELPGTSLPWGAFGENLTTEGLLEDEVRIGDALQIGSAVFQVTEPRMPCFKLDLRFNRSDMVKRFLASGRSGFYLSVTVEGELGAGDRVTLTRHDDGAPSVSDVVAVKRHRMTR